MYCRCRDSKKNIYFIRGVRDVSNYYFYDELGMLCTRHVQRIDWRLWFIVLFSYFFFDFPLGISNSQKLRKFCAMR